VKKLSVLLLKSYIGPFIITFMVAMFIFEMQFIWVYLDELLGKGLSGWVIFKLLVFASARLVNMALPLAILMSSIMTMGALAENNEMTAMKGAGVSLLRIMRPLIFFSLGLSLTAFVFANNIWPVANLKFRTMLFSILKQKPALNLTDGVFYSGIEGVSIRAGRNNPETGELTDVLIYDHRGGEKANRTVIRASRGLMEQTADKRYLILTLFDGHSYDEQKEKKIREPKRALIEGTFDKMELRMDLSSLAFTADNEEVMKNPAEMMSVVQLDQAIDSLYHVIDTVKLQFTSNNTRLMDKRFLRPSPSDNKLSVEERRAIKERMARDSSRQKLADANGLVAAPVALNTLLSIAEQAKALQLAKENTRKSRDLVQRQNDELRSRLKNVNRHKIEWHRKFFLAAVCFVLFFIGAPLGAIIRKGGLGIPTLIALGLFVFYQLLTMAGERMAKNQIIEPWLGMWISTVVLLPLSIWITWRAMKETTFGQGNAISRGFIKLARLFKRKPKEVMV
jgi:lipopolysaccharide export system permease protein